MPPNKFSDLDVPRTRTCKNFRQPQCKRLQRGQKAGVMPYHRRWANKRMNRTHPLMGVQYNEMLLLATQYFLYFFQFQADLVNYLLRLT